MPQVERVSKKLRQVTGLAWGLFPDGRRRDRWFEWSERFWKIDNLQRDHRLFAGDIWQRDKIEITSCGGLQVHPTEKGA